MRIGDCRLRYLLAALLLVLELSAGVAVARADDVAGSVTQVTGKAEIQRGSTKIAVTAGMPVQLHDQVSTAAGGQLTLKMIDGSMLTLNESSKLVIDENVVSGGVRSSTTVGLLGGSLRSLVTTVARSAGTTTFKVETPNAIAGVRGTEFTTSYSDGTARKGFTNCLKFTDVTASSGKVVLANNPPKPGVEVAVTPGHKATVACGAAPILTTYRSARQLDRGGYRGNGGFGRSRRGRGYRWHHRGSHRRHQRGRWWRSDRCDCEPVAVMRAAANATLRADATSVAWRARAGMPNRPERPPG